MADYTVSSELITKARAWLRITSEAYDDEIGQTIEACRHDLQNSGVVVWDTTDDLILQAVKLYLKAQFGFNDGEDKFSRAYEFLKAGLSLSGDYNETGGDENA